MRKSIAGILLFFLAFFIVVQAQSIKFDFIVDTAICGGNAIVTVRADTYVPGVLLQIVDANNTLLVNEVRNHNGVITWDNGDFAYDTGRIRERTVTVYNGPDASSGIAYQSRYRMDCTGIEDSEPAIVTVTNCIVCGGPEEPTATPVMPEPTATPVMPGPTATPVMPGPAESPDNRLNWQCGDSHIAIVYPGREGALDVYDYASAAYTSSVVTPADLASRGEIARSGAVTFYGLEGGRLLAFIGPDREGKFCELTLDSDLRTTLSKNFVDPNE